MLFVLLFYLFLYKKVNIINDIMLCLFECFYKIIINIIYTQNNIKLQTFEL